MAHRFQRETLPVMQLTVDTSARGREDYATVAGATSRLLRRRRRCRCRRRCSRSVSVRRRRAVFWVVGAAAAAE